MSKMLGMILLLMSLSQVAVALQCKVRIEKATCWANYNVSVQVKTSSSHDKRTVLLTRKAVGKPAVFTKEVSIPCKPGSKIMYFAQFNPAIWDGDKSSALIEPHELISVPQHIPENSSEVAVSICYPKDFKNAPFPYEYKPGCDCKGMKSSDKKHP